MKIMKSLRFAYFASMCMLLSCENDTDTILKDVLSNANELTIEEATALELSVKGTSVSYEDAIKEANSVMNCLDKADPETRSVKQRNIKSVDFLINQKAQTRSLIDSTEQDTLMYLINYDNEEGFALLSADKRTESLFAVSNKGHLSLNDTIDNPGLYIFLCNAVGLYNQQIDESESQLQRALNKLSNKTIPEVSTRSGSDDIQYGDWVDDVDIRPLLKTKWRQYYPFNYNAPIIDGKQAVAGCVAVATGQIMYYFRHPSSINWGLIDLFKSNPRNYDAEDYIAAWFRSMGDALSMNWGVESSVAPNSAVPVYLSNMGYSSSGTMKEYNLSRIINALSAARPIYISGFSIKNVTYNTKSWLLGGKKANISYESGHSWVIDGYMFRWREIKTNGVISREYEYLVHCNWGWGDSKTDGYYNSEVFDTRNGPVVPTRTYGDRYYYQFKLEIMSDIKP